MEQVVPTEMAFPTVTAGVVLGWISLLPHLEQGNMFNTIMAGDGVQPPEGPRAWRGWGPWNTSPSYMRCPSDPAAFVHQPGEPTATHLAVVTKLKA